MVGYTLQTVEMSPQVAIWHPLCLFWAGYVADQGQILA